MTEAIRVKALEWQGEPYLHDGKRYVETVYARTPIEYTLIEEAPGRWKCFRPAGTWGNLEEAKAACQADFARRVGECVEMDEEKDAAIAEAVHTIENLKGSLEVMRQGVARRDEDIDALQARCDELEAAALSVLAHLTAAVSVIKTSEENGNHPSCAYGSDTMYRMAMKDFDRCMEAGRKALRSVVDGGE